MKVIVDNYNNACARVICKGCKSVLEFVRRDIKYLNNNMGDLVTYIECPLCKHTTHVNLNDLKPNNNG